MNVLVTGGAGYIGSHALIELLNARHSVIAIDNLSNSNRASIERVEKITNSAVPFYELDLRHKENIDQLFADHSFDAVMHFAGLKSVGESIKNPLDYYHGNVVSTLNLIDSMQKNNVKKLVFSSSATVYGNSDKLPLSEDGVIGKGITNPYGHTKFMIEQILRDLSHADGSMEITILRYFNPIGAHYSGLIGEDPHGRPNNIFPLISQVAVRKSEKVKIFGGDYDTPDGTGVRDYIHVEDLAKGHVAAINYSSPGVSTYNLGTGRGISVLELIAAFSKASGQHIPYEIVSRRPGDIAACYADPTKANLSLQWFAKKTLEESCLDAWRWQSNNPDGYTKIKTSYNDIFDVS